LRVVCISTIHKINVIYKYFQMRISTMHVVLMLKDLTDKP
jgi:hypothetical protein